ncbi:hypothetical protein GA0116996_11261 [Cupriavidus alkaliphilus]|nr:hypothetical protein GA0116996_11261 [Cupriavidus alkaliphilus]
MFKIDSLSNCTVNLKEVNFSELGFIERRHPQEGG